MTPEELSVEERIAHLEQAVEILAEHIDLLAYLHVEQRYRTQVALLRQVLTQPGAMEKVQQIVAAVKAQPHQLAAAISPVT